MCSLERNKNAGNLVVRRNDSTRPSSRREKINCCWEEWRARGASKNVDAHEVRVTRMTKAGGIKLEPSEKGQRSKQGNECLGGSTMGQTTR